jgi:hypothetical protein
MSALISLMWPPNVTRPLIVAIVHPDASTSARTVH